MLLFAYTITLGSATAMIPFSGSLSYFYVACMISGFFGGSLDTGGNVLCLDIWQGCDDSGPYMHSIHFSFGFGAFVAPLIAQKFLRNNVPSEISPHQTNQTIMMATQTMTNLELGIETLYPILGAFAVFVSLGYLTLGIKDLSQSVNFNEEILKNNKASKFEEDNKLHSNNSKMIVLVLVFLFLYAGMEVMYGTYLTTFAVQCKLHLSRQTGARMTAVFWGTFTLMRFLAIFISVKLNPVNTLVFSFILSVIGSTLLAIFGETSTGLLAIFSAFMGVGMAPIYASSMLWLDQFMTVTNKIGSLMTIAASIGADSFPLILGQFISTFPMLLMYMQIGVIYSCILLFSLASCIGKQNRLR